MEIEIQVETQIKNAINWLKALLSGEYKQGKGRLGDPVMGFCCWGLGCYIVNIDYNPIDGWNDNLHKHIGFLYCNSALLTPLQVEHLSLAAANDSGVSFLEIAKHLIKYSDECFVPEVSQAIKKHPHFQSFIN